MLLDILLELLGGMLAGKRVGVVAIGQQQHLHIHTFLQQHIRTTHGGMDTSLITIVEQHDIGGKAVQQSYLIVAQCRTAVSHDILQATLVHGDDVGIALHHIHAVFLDDSFLRLIDAIELAFLMIDFGVGRVDVFLLHALRSGIELTTTKGHHLTTHIQPREDGTTRKAVD